ncbi:hypothetical protein ACIF80_34710 [Streptomyces sp. NPDC085927]|uniref:hypothetical protein n=1 Tax=Streptomyces sp. NPDC085927 TaxID=3365738 RepID=UPI0037D5FA0F
MFRIQRRCTTSGGLQLAQSVGDVLVVLGEELQGEVDDGAGDAFRRVRPGLRPGPQRGHEDAPEGLQSEGVRARLARFRAGQRGDGDDDPFDDVDEQLGHPRLAAGELAGGVDVVGLHGPEVAERADGRVRGHRGERHVGGGHDGSSRTRRRADRSGLISDLQSRCLWIESTHRR